LWRLSERNRDDRDEPGDDTGGLVQYDRDTPLQ
jgi:hypothetical protein